MNSRDRFEQRVPWEFQEFLALLSRIPDPSFPGKGAQILGKASGGSQEGSSWEKKRGLGGMFSFQNLGIWDLLPGNPREQPRAVPEEFQVGDWEKFLNSHTQLGRIPEFSQNWGKFLDFHTELERIPEFSH